MNKYILTSTIALGALFPIAAYAVTYTGSLQATPTNTNTEASTDIITAAGSGAGPQKSSTETETDRVDSPSSKPQEGSTDAYIKIKGVDGESTEKGTLGKPKFEDIKKTESSKDIDESDDRDDGDDSEPITPDFGILLGGGGDDEDTDDGEEKHKETAQIILQSMQEVGEPVRTLSIRSNKLEAEVEQTIKFLGLVPFTAVATVEIDAEERIKVKFPWWAFLSTGKESEALGEQIFSAISNVLKTKHDTVKNSINNVR